ncbi:hypothetical protein AKJ16_DCAP14962 [Drosera capensis]
MTYYTCAFAWNFGLENAIQLPLLARNFDLRLLIPSPRVETLDSQSHPSQPGLLVGKNCSHHDIEAEGALFPQLGTG